MNIHIARLVATHDSPADPINIQVQHTPAGATLLAMDFSGNVLATRTLNYQLGDIQLTGLVVADLKTTLLAFVREQHLFPQPMVLEPERR